MLRCLQPPVLLRLKSEHMESAICYINYGESSNEKKIFCTVHFYLHVMSVKDLEIVFIQQYFTYFSKRVRIKIELTMIKQRKLTNFKSSNGIEN